MKKIKKIIFVLVLLTVISLVSLFIYFEKYYHAEKNSFYYLKNHDVVKVEKINNGYFFDGSGDDYSLIFYQGAKVEAEAYSQLMFKLAQNGIDCFLIDMPFRFALLGINEANKILNNYNYKNWTIMGHSLGGVAATSFVNKNPNKFNNIIYLGSYPNKKINNDIKLLSIYGDNDKVLNKEKYESEKINWPSISKEYVIIGGNHANFGNYGAQKGDGKAWISNEDQQNQTVTYILNFILND